MSGLKWYMVWRVVREPAYAAVAYLLGWLISRYGAWAPPELGLYIAGAQLALRRLYRDNIDLTGKRLDLYLQKLYDSGFRVPPAR